MLLSMLSKEETSVKMVIDVPVKAIHLHDASSVYLYASLLCTLSLVLVETSWMGKTLLGKS